MQVSFDIRGDKKQRRNGEARRASPTSFRPRLINLTSEDTFVVFCLSCIISRCNDEKAVKQMKSRRRFGRNC